MNILARRQQWTIFICCVVIMFFSITLSAMATPSNKKLGNGNTTYNLRITKMQCVDTPYKRSILHNCTMVHLPNNTVGLNISVEVPIVLSFFQITVKVYYKYTTYRPFMIDWTIELCQALRNRNLNPSTVFVMKVYADSLPEFYYPCPHGNRTYAFFWTLEPSYIPSTLPSGDYRLDVYYQDSTHTTLFAFRIYGSVRKQGLIG
ncbi:uncharacterized protein LOC128717810 [Anopheles marshallii]|uniref:uncharacterized protein LOC128717810 n=1 Tax=Anopheles marshallii TaxID=1521116 RepID=UPI00237A8E6B|nr:uncharacterized protein LOC128717810 [Anopheles marshallii]